MRVMQRFQGPLVAGLVLAACLSLAYEPASGQNITPEQLQIFQGLSPEQQQAVLNAIGGGGGQIPGQLPSQLGRSRQPGGQVGSPTDLERERLKKAEGEETEPVIPVLKPEDWVVIEIDYQLPPRPIPPYLQSLYAAQTGLASATASLGTQSSAANPATAAAPTASAPGSQTQSNATGTPVTVYESQLSEDDRAKLDALMVQIRLRNPYRLSRDGALTLPGFPPIALLGLTEEQATLRLKVEPAFRGIEIRLTRLPIKKTGAEGLKPFGYDLFDHPLSTFAPITNVPVPASYIVGPGDELDVLLYGNQNRYLRLVVARDGRVNMPDLGPVSVAGQTFDEVKAGIESRVQRQMIGVHASVSMGDTRSIQVFVLGEAKYPGTYTISALGTITSALYAAGGAKRSGSLRTIQLKRQGTLVRELDLYDLLIRGDTTDDSKLLSGDVILIPPVGATASIDGEVIRPAVYELKSESTVAELLRLAGGLTPEADRSNAMLTRIDENQHRIVIPVELSTSSTRETLRNGDLVRVMRLRPTLDSGILVEGHLYAPGAFAYRTAIRLSDVIHSVDELRPNADIHYLLIRRELPPDRRITALSVDLAAALKAPGSAADVELMPRDRITVFDLSSGRDHVIQPLLDELRVQGTAAHPTETVHVDGQVKVPGEYPLEPGMRVSDLIRAGGGPADPAYNREAELTRYTIGSSGSRHTELLDIDLAGVLRGDAAANIQLQPFDALTVKEIPFWEEGEKVTIKGEVGFPGTYIIRRGETLKSVIKRAGGFTQFAFADGSVFLREWLRQREQEQLSMLAARMEKDVTALALAGAAAGQGGGGANAVTVAHTLLAQLQGAKAIGRMVIDLPRLMREPVGSPYDVVLRGGDQLIVPRFQQQVTVLGEVQNSTSLFYNSRLSRDDYIAQSGGVTRRADRSQIYVVRANGGVVANQGSAWFRPTSSVRIRPGDTIVVPLNVERMPPLPFWQAVTSILYNVAIAAAAVHSL